MRDLERSFLSMLWEKPSYDGDFSDALDLEEEVESYAVKEQISSVEPHEVAKELVRRARQRDPEIHRTEDRKAKSSSPSSERKRRVEKWLEQQHEH